MVMNNTVENKIPSVLDVDKHQTLFDANGNRTGVLIPAEDYDYLLKLIENEAFLKDLEESFHSALDQVAEAKAGRKKMKSLQSVIDEL